MEEKNIIDMIQKKGLTVDCFDPMDEMLEAYEEYVRKMEKLQKKLENNIKSVISEDEFFESYLPVTEYDIEDLKKDAEKIKNDCIRCIGSVVQTKFTKIKVFPIENGDIFNARKTMFDLLEENKDEELICLEQIQENIKRWLPNKEIAHTGKKSIQFVVSVNSWNDMIYEVPRINELSMVIFDNVKPTETDGIKNTRAGDKINRFHFEATFYKNGKMTVKFDTEKECKKFAEAIFADPKEILSKIGE